MEFIKTHRKVITISIIFVIVAVTHLLPISFGDFYSDNAINAFRAYGWLDYFGTSGQTTPLQWFGSVPGWAQLSFHDAPPLAFLIQHIFFSILGGGTGIARLSFVLAGILSIWLVYKLLKKLTNETVALIASLAYAVSSYAAWASQAAYLEGIQELFVVGSLLFGATYLFKDQSKKNIYLWMLFFAMALMTKYTAVFLIPPALFYLFLFRSEFKKQWKHFLIALVLFVAIISPVVIYNANLYQTRGHFDAAFSSMIGMHSEDFTIISDRSTNTNIFLGILGLLKTLANNISYPFLILAIICFFLLCWSIKKTGIKSFESWLVANTLFLCLVLDLAGSPVRFSSLVVPFLATIIGLGVYRAHQMIKSEGTKRLLLIVVGVVMIVELVYSLNTNVLKRPITTSSWFYSDNKIQSLGFNQVDHFIRSNPIKTLPAKSAVKTKDDLIFSNKDIENRSVVIFDDRINWFAQMWYFQRYFLNHRWPVISTAFIVELEKSSITIQDLMSVSGQPLYFIYPINDDVIEKTRASDVNISKIGDDLASRLDAVSASSTIIYNKNNIPSFKIYKVDSL